uniref:Uncharacterized protein n=1 Tax=Neobodo designis TaxID=312471 RepID=A0A7S1R5P0_NEODS|mmetsp:Transcript_8836/g.27431  ORF Transcript_8836/g.27431 Transcript_8836/m.27431 type:complete len:173 (+) Transcript_8836:225-743(+)
MGCAGSVESEAETPRRVRKEVRPAEEDGSRGSNDSKYREEQDSSASSSGRQSQTTAALPPRERAQVEAIKQRRRSLGRPCSLAADDTMRHYRLVTGNIRDDDDYYDASRIRVRSGSTMSWCDESTSSEGGSPLLSRRSSMRRASFSSTGLRKSVSFSAAPTGPKWRPSACVK